MCFISIYGMWFYFYIGLMCFFIILEMCFDKIKFDFNIIECLENLMFFGKIFYLLNCF